MKMLKEACRVPGLPSDSNIKASTDFTETGILHYTCKDIYHQKIQLC